MSKESKKGEKRTLLEYLSYKCDIGTDSLSGEVYIEMRGQNCIFVKGCRRILGYSPESVLLEIKDNRLSIKGKRLVCTSFHSGSVSVEGLILSVGFGGEEEV